MKDSTGDKKINKKLLKELNQLFEFIPPRKMKDTLTEVYLDYCLNMLDLPINFKQNAECFDGLIRFLKTCEKIRRKMKKLADE